MQRSRPGLETKLRRLEAENAHLRRVINNLVRLIAWAASKQGCSREVRDVLTGHGIAMTIDLEFDLKGDTISQ